MKEKDSTREELIREVAELRLRLAASEGALEELRSSGSEERAECLDRIESMQRAREALGMANFIVEHSPAVLFRREANEDAKLVYVSENVSQWGYTAAEFLSGELTFRDIIMEEDAERMGEELSSFRDSNAETYSQEYRIRTRGGGIRWISDATSVICGDDGAPLFNQGVLLDITRRKEAEQALARNEFKFRRTIEGAGQGYLLMDAGLNIREVNEAYSRMLGYAREDLLGRRPHDFATLEYQRFLEANRERFKMEMHRRFEGSMIHRSGRVVPVLVNAHTLLGEDGEFLGHVAFVTDLTEQKKALELAGEVQKSLLPERAPSIPGLDVAGASVASEVASGDYFDYLEGLDPEHPTLSLAVGDISGHGVDAALLMTTARGFLRMRAGQPGSPAQIVTEMNRHLSEDLEGSGRFMTLFYLNLDPEQRVARWVRAGHDPALIYCPYKDAFTELGADVAGLPLGVIGTSTYPEASGEVHPGQIIAIGTDGIWESRDASGQMFGKARFRQVLRDNARGSAKDILDAVFEAVRIFTDGARADDDITLVVVKYGSGEEAVPCPEEKATDGVTSA
ncbi:SpoIIE family protein phosphatase [Pseudodesulfovibrio cashew]|uniref:SpoIIE family protein phosphatase n=1 Tax=Pseudodesulfovibrio cashew TaxID=2678688 RepID=A0A6I6JE88_9BACT|nr:SpoIIE family protein phosphatase [Pseudodesulfovibrio cashew]QGY39328.1 SpoIIE family protein phosphatase [Pseudodesulfovibrio cashew]